MMVRLGSDAQLNHVDSMEKSLSTFAAEMATSAMVLGMCFAGRADT
jgi:hypothetical protein